MKIIKQINLKDYIEATHKEARTADGDFYIYEIVYQPQRNYPFKINEYACCICLEGEAKGCIDLMPCCLTPSTMAVNVPGQLLEQHSMSNNFKGIGIVMSQEFIKRLGLPYNFQLDKVLRKSPIIELQPSLLDALLMYYSMVHRLLEKERPYQMETLHHLICAFFYGIGSHLYQVSIKRHSTYEETLMQDFLSEIKIHYRCQRKVGFYADRLHISLGHFFAIVKRVSGKSPGQWIDEYITEEARALLKGTNLTVQQISQELGFPSQSFFGKFFKRMAGLSPKEYREQ